MALPGKVIEFVWLDFDQNSPHGGPILQVGIMEKQASIIEFGVVEELIETSSSSAATTAN
jgi:hypothetical protein